MSDNKDKVVSTTEIVFNNMIGDNSIIMSLRSGGGIDENVYQETVTACKTMIPLLADQQYVPKKLAQCFVDVSNSVYSSEELYTQEVFERFEDMAHELNYLGQELFTSK